MSVEKLDKEIRKALLHCRALVEELVKSDSNEADTRTRVDHILEKLMGYDRFRYITAEYAIHGVGDTVHCDMAIKLDHEETSKPDLLVEVKRVGIDLAPKHIRQAASYAIDIGCEWILLTNSKDWRLYHISFGKPPITQLVDSWNIIDNEPVVLARKFDLVGYKSVKKGYLAQLWAKSNVLTTQNMIRAILSEESIILIRKNLKKWTDIVVTPEEIVGAIRHLLNEGSVSEMEKIKICLPERKQRRKREATTAAFAESGNIQLPVEETKE